MLACACLIDDISIALIESQHSLRVIEVAHTHVTSMDLFLDLFTICLVAANDCMIDDALNECPCRIKTLITSDQSALNVYRSEKGYRCI